MLDDGRTRKLRAERLPNDDARRTLASRKKNPGLSDCNNIGLKGNKNAFLDENGKKPD